MFAILAAGVALLWNAGNPPAPKNISEYKLPITPVIRTGTVQFEPPEN